MTHITVPAKTFLLGEYAALSGGSAIILTTTPCFRIDCTDDGLLKGIHRDSPAGRYWTQHAPVTQGLCFNDPYVGQGGLGASSAQFLGAYQLLHPEALDREALLTTYIKYAWHGDGVKPSGYDLLAQAEKGCVYINRQKNIIQSYPWPFDDIAFLLVHTGNKLATHEHLQSLTTDCNHDALSIMVDEAQTACLRQDSDTFTQLITRYQQALMAKGLSTEPTQQLLAHFLKKPAILAAKGCGALGADVILLIVRPVMRAALCEQLAAEGFRLLPGRSPI